MTLLPLFEVDEPAALVAVTVKVYLVPSVRPVNTQDVESVSVQPLGGVTVGVATTL
jgi:hypothetical protein